MTLIGAVFRICWYLIKNQNKKRECLNLEKAGNIQARDEKVRALVPEWANYMIDLMGNHKATVEVFGQENIPQDTAVVFIANHQGYLDIPVLLAHSNKQLGNEELTVSIVDVPLQMFIVPTISISGASFTVTKIESLAVQPR